MELSRQNCIDLYTNVIDDTIKSVRSKWTQNGGDPRVLNQLEELWKAKSLNFCGLNLQEPLGFSQRKKKAESEKQITLEEILGTSINQESVEKEEEEEFKSETISDVDTISSDDDINEVVNKENIEIEEKVESGESISDDSDDPEINNLVKLPESSHLLTCHCINSKYLKSKDPYRKMKFSYCHFQSLKDSLSFKECIVDVKINNAKKR